MGRLCFIQLNDGNTEINLVDYPSIERKRKSLSTSHKNITTLRDESDLEIPDGLVSIIVTIKDRDQLRHHEETVYFISCTGNLEACT